MSDVKVEQFQSEEPKGSIGGVLSVVSKVSNWKTYLVYLLLAVMVAEGGVIIWQRGNVALAKVEVSNKNLEINRLTTERDIAKANEKEARDALSSQNKLIQDAGNNYVTMQDEFTKLAKSIQDGIKNGTIYKKADDVRNQQTPKSCQEALDFMNRNTTHEN